MIGTTSEQRDILDAIEILLASLYLKKRGDLQKKISPYAYEFINKRGQINEAFLKGLKEKIVNLPTISLTLAFEPPKETRARLSAWVKANLGQDLILDITVDESIVGGALVSFGGKYRDYSLRKKIEEVFAKNEEFQILS